MKPELIGKVLGFTAVLILAALVFSFAVVFGVVAMVHLIRWAF